MGGGQERTQEWRLERGKEREREMELEGGRRGIGREKLGREQ